MPCVRLILEDDYGQALPDTTEQVYPLEGTCDTLNQIEQAVVTFKNTALPQMGRRCWHKHSSDSSWSRKKRPHT